MIEYGENLIQDENKVWNEIDLIFDQMRPPELTGVAVVDGKNLKSGKGFYISGQMAEVVLPEMCKIKSKFSQDKFTLLINYYEDGDYYDEHSDDSVKTLTVILCKDSENIIGGDLVVGDVSYPVKNNTYVFFDGKIKHRVTEVKTKIKKEKFGRFSLNFFFYKD